ncbi:MAG: CPBP family intramembrane glutamic endopeptidase [Pseudomonadota bacterium]
MPRLLILLTYFVSIFVVGCLLAYPVHLIIDTSFERIVSRSVLICAILFFYPTYKALNIKSFSELGFTSSSPISNLAQSWGLGVVMLLPISFLYIACGYRFWEPVAPNLIDPTTTIVTAIIAGLLIGLIEETILRGFLQSQLSKLMTLSLSVVFVNVIYSSVHFLQPPETFTLETIHWYSGFTLLVAAFSSLLNFELVWDSWIALFLAGVFLSIVRIRTNLLWCIGIHAGWVAHIKVFKSFTDRDNTASCKAFASDYDNYVGEFSAVWLLAILAIWGIYYLVKIRKSHH